MFWFILYLITALLAAIYTTAVEAKKGDLEIGLAIFIFAFTLILTPVALILGLIFLVGEN